MTESLDPTPQRTGYALPFSRPVVTWVLLAIIVVVCVPLAMKWPSVA